MRLSEKFETIQILKTVTISFLIFNVAMIFPLTSFVYPVYKIRANTKLSPKEIFIVNTALFLLIGLVSKFTVIFYVSLFLVVEVFYHLFENLKIKIKTFDRIIITTLISTGMLILLLSQSSDTLEILKKTITDVYTNQYGISQRDLSLIFNYMAKYKIFLLYLYTGAVSYFSYFVLKKEEYKDWKISYQWIIPYIIAFFISKYADFGKVISANTLAILKITYALYGIKLIYNLINSKINNSIISQVGALILGFYFSGITFIVGALECFELIKIHIVKLNNGGKR